MNYDKSSFLSGVAVGRQLRGWGVERRSSGGEAAVALAVNAEPLRVLGVLAPPASGFGASAPAVFAYLSTGEVQVDLGTLTLTALSAGTLGAPTISRADAPDRALSLSLSASAGGTLQINALMEVNEHE